MIKRLAVVLVILAGLPGSIGPVRAGGMATVHLDAAPTGVVVGAPVTIGFTVLQHDVNAVNVDSALLEATHRKLGETVQATAVQIGAVGHYEVEVTFPAAGSWKWTITPEPFAGTSFESIEVAETRTGTPTWTAELRSGTCAAPDALLTEINDLLGQSPNADGSTSPVAVIQAALPVVIRDLTIAPHALLVTSSGTVIACADMTGTIQDGELIVGISSAGDSGTSGIARVADTATGSVLTMYLSTARPGRNGAESASQAVTVTVTITGTEGSWVYSPARVQVPAGGTVIWVNHTDVSHTVTGSSLTYEDSSPILPGESWSQTFRDVGTFDYYCAPHPFMTGQVEVV